MLKFAKLSQLIKEWWETRTSRYHAIHRRFADEQAKAEKWKQRTEEATAKLRAAVGCIGALIDTLNHGKPVWIKKNVIVSQQGKEVEITRDEKQNLRLRMVKGGK